MIWAELENMSFPDMTVNPHQEAEGQDKLKTGS